MGPYYVRNAIPEKGPYELEELDGTPVLGTHLGNRLKKFVKRDGIYELVGQQSEVEEEEEENSALVDRPP